MQEEIIKRKKEKDICILAHAYQSHDIWAEVADYVGDSFGLAQKAAEAPQKDGSYVRRPVYGGNRKTAVAGKDRYSSGAGRRMPNGGAD